MALSTSVHDLRTLIRSLGVENRTTFTGLLRGRARIEALADADVVVYASEDEIFGLFDIKARPKREKHLGEPRP